jgi:hypothetical protein
MSFGYLPLQLYIIMNLIVFGTLLYYSIEGWKKNPKIFSVGLFVLGISSLGAGLTRLGEEKQLFGDSIQFNNSFTIWIGVAGTILSLIGSLQKVKDDPIKKRFVVIMLGVLVAIVALMSILVIYLANHRLTDY